METVPPPTGPVQANPPASAPLVPGTLYLVATPIGNLEDITFRALRVLRECSVVAAEDTRHTGQLLTHFGLRKQMVSYFRFNEARRGAEILDRLRCGETVALVTDAGSPGISDPGERIVAEVLAAGLRVESIPGACALVTGLTASGLPTESFHFAGFLPHKSGQRARRLTELGAIPGTLVLYESPFRVERLLGELQRILPGRRVVLARELTKKVEKAAAAEAKKSEAETKKVEKAAAAEAKKSDAETKKVEKAAAAEAKKSEAETKKVEKAAAAELKKSEAETKKVEKAAAAELKKAEAETKKVEKAAAAELKKAEAETKKAAAELKKAAAIEAEIVIVAKPVVEVVAVIEEVVAVIEEVKAVKKATTSEEKDAKKAAAELKKTEAAAKKAEKSAAAELKKTEAETKKAEKEAKKAATELKKASKKEKEVVKVDILAASVDDDEEEVEVEEFEFKGVTYLRSSDTNIVYDANEDVVGKWNEATNVIDFTAELQEEEYVE